MSDILENPFLVFLVFILPILIVGLVLIIVLSIRYKDKRRRYKEFVKANSGAIRALKEINNKYVFYRISNPVLREKYDDQNYYNQLSCKDYLIYDLTINEQEYLSSIGKAELNKRKYEEYKKEIKEKCKFGKIDNVSDEYSNKNLLLDSEREAFNELLVHPKTEFKIGVRLTLHYQSGDVKDYKREWFGTNEIIKLAKCVDDKTGYFYNDRGIWDALCRVERAKVALKIRNTVFSRDGFKCKKCGCSDRTLLEVDHIKPISRGGKTELNNLQTLCHRCNKEKGSN